MSDTSDSRPRGFWYLLLHRKLHPTWQQRIVHWGFATSAIFTILMFANVLVPSLLWPLRYWIGLIYLMFQLAEVVARDPLDMGEIMEDHIFSLAPAILGLVLTLLNWRSGYSLMTSEGLSTMHFWHAVAWTDFIFGLAISMRILSTSFRRDETRAPRS